jgi:hypothetical protein
MRKTLAALTQARAAAASAMCAHVHATQQRQQLLRWSGVAIRMRSVRELLLNAQRRRAKRTLAAALRCWRQQLHLVQLKRTRRAAALAWACRRMLVTVLAAWATASKQLAAERDAALQILLLCRALRSASALVSGWRLAARNIVDARFAAMERLSIGIEGCRLRACIVGWAEHAAAVHHVTALLEGHAGRRRRRLLRGNFLAWGGAAREAAEGRDVLAVCLACNAADRRRAAVLKAWQDAAKWSVYVRSAVAQFRCESHRTVMPQETCTPERRLS